MTPAHPHPRSATGPVKGTARHTGALARRRTLTLTVVLAALALHGASAASALTQRGHVFCQTCTFGASGEGGLSHPGELAVSESTGDVYVLDRGHDRIVQYSSTGQFISAWGWGVHGAKGSWQVCTSGCGPGAPHRAFQLSGAQAIAVDNATSPEDPSKGDLYVIAPREHEEEAYEAVEKYSPEGKPLERITKIPYQEAGEREEIEEPEAEETHGLTLDADGTAWLYYEETLYPLNNAALKKPSTLQPLTFSLAGEPAAGLAAGPDGRFYLGQDTAGPAGQPLDVTSAWQTVPESQELEELREGLDHQNTTALAVNPDDRPADQVDEEGDTYITNTAAGASTLAQFNPDGTLIQRISAAGLSEAAGVAVNPATGAVYITDAATGDVDVFTLEEASAPAVDGLSVQEVSSGSAQLNARVDPHGAASTYAFRYSPEPVPPAGKPCASPCVETPAPEEAIGEAYADHAVSAQLKAGTGAPVQPATTYHYRVIARNPLGSGESTEQTFSTPPVTGAFIADERVWEMVSPAAARGAQVEALTFEGGLIQAAAGGGAITYLTDAPVGHPEGSRSYEPTQLLSTRGSEGWASQDLMTPNERGVGLGTGDGSEYRFFSEDLSLALVQPFSGVSKMAEPPLAPPASEVERQRSEEQQRNGEPDDYQEHWMTSATISRCNHRKLWRARSTLKPPATGWRWATRGSWRSSATRTSWREPNSGRCRRGAGPTNPRCSSVAPIRPSARWSSPPKCRAPRGVRRGRSAVCRAFMSGAPVSCGS